MAPVPEDATKIVVKTKRGFAGKTVLVNVILENNPGIWGMDLAVSYDKTKLTLNSVTNGDVFADSNGLKAIFPQRAIFFPMRQTALRM